MRIGDLRAHRLLVIGGVKCQFLTEWHLCQRVASSERLASFDFQFPPNNIVFCTATLVVIRVPGAHGKSQLISSIFPPFHFC